MADEPVAKTELEWYAFIGAQRAAVRAYLARCPWSPWRRLRAFCSTVLLDRFERRIRTSCDMERERLRGTRGVRGGKLVPLRKLRAEIPWDMKTRRPKGRG